MTDWAAHLGRTRRMMENLAWLGSAALVMLLLATSVALAMYMDKRAGDGAVETVIIELPPIPTDVVAEDPGPAPETSAAAPDAPDAPDLDDAPPQTETAVEEAPEIELPEELPPPEDVAEQLPDMTPPPPLPEPEPEPVQKAEVELPKPVKKAEPVKKKAAKKAEKPAEAQGKKSTASEQKKAGGATAAGAKATASAEARWKSKVQSTVARHMKRKNFGARGTVTLTINVAGSGAVTGVSVSGSTGDPGVDASIRAHAQGIGSLPAPPSGTSQRLTAPIKVR